MAQAQNSDDDTQKSLEKVKKRLSSPTASCLMEGSLLKRSETLRKWNQRWFTLDPTTGKMEYRVQRGDASPRGLIGFEADSTITLSPINFNGARKYDGCCFYIGTPQKKEFYLCAETPTIARAWVSTLRAASLVLKAHKEAVDSLSGNGHAKLGTVYAVVAAANATAKEGMKEMEQSMKTTMKPVQTNSSLGNDMPGDDVSTVMKETLRVKDEELNQVARDLRARDYMIKEMADRLSETAEAAEAAALAARTMEKERTLAQAELEDLKKEFDDRLYHAVCEVRAGDERLAAALKAREIALQEAQRWRVELGKGREQIVMMEAAVLRAEDNARRGAADAEEKVKAAKAHEMVALTTKDDAINLAKQWQAQAEYYQGQAARYLGMLQQNEVAPESTREQVEDSVPDEKTEESPSAIPVQELGHAGLVETGPDVPVVSAEEQNYDTTSRTVTPPTPEVKLAPTPEVQVDDKSVTDDPREVPAPTISADSGSSNDKFSNYITAVDFEQLQVDTFHFPQRPPVPSDEPVLSYGDSTPPSSPSPNTVTMISGSASPPTASPTVDETIDTSPKAE